jgi:Flp pilus assembly protein TadG
MLALLLAAGLGVDISRLYLAKNELQNAADAAALSGASALNAHPEGITEATDRAVLEMNKYAFNKTNVSITRASVRFAKNLDDFDSGQDYSEGGASADAVAKKIRFVKVTTPDSPVGLSFAAMVLGKTRNLKATAVAGMSLPLNTFSGYIPLAVIDDNVSVITPGQVYTIRAAPDNNISPGNYQILAVDDPGASDDRVGLASGVRNVVGPGGTVDTKPGVSSGAVRQGINTRFDDYASGLDPVSYPPDTNIKEDISYSDYLAGTKTQPPSHAGVDGRRVVLIPIVKKQEFDNGRDEVVIDRFGAFFLQSKVSGGNGGDIKAEYIDEAVVVGNGGYDPTGPANSGPPITKPVLYR